MAKSTGGRKSVPQMPAGVAKPSPSTSRDVGVTRPIQKPSPSTVGQVGITPPAPGKGSGKKGAKY